MDELLSLAQEIQIFCAIVTKTARRDLEQRLAGEEAGIGALPFGVLRVLEHEPLTLAELSRRMQLAAPSLLPAVDALERQGLLTRERDPNDRRRTPLAITVAGRATLGRIPALAPDDSLVRSIAALAPEQAEALRQLLRALISKIDDGEAIVRGVAARVQHNKEQ